MAFGFSRLEDEELYRKVLMIFPPAQLVLGWILYGSSANTGLLWGILLVLAAICFLISRYGWQSVAGRIAGRTLWLLLTVGFLAAAGTVLAASSADYAQGTAMLMSLAPIMLHTVLLFMIPPIAQAALHGRRWDATALRVASAAQLVLGVLLYWPLADLVTWGVDNIYFRVFCLACMVAVTVTAFLISPAPTLFSRHAKKASADRDK